MSISDEPTDQVPNTEYWDIFTLIHYKLSSPKYWTGIYLL